MHEVRNRLDAMNSWLGKGEELINNLEDKVKESN